MKRNITCQLLLALFFGVTLTASAQNHSIRISDGVVFIDGHEQASSDLPGTLVVDGVSASLSFSGMTRFRIGETTYKISDGILLEADVEADQFVVVLGLDPTGNVGLFERAPEPHRQWDAEYAPKSLNVYYDLLNSEVSALDEAREAFGREQSIHVVSRINQSAEKAALMVRAFPQIELQSYMEGVQERNQGLYDGILREHLMEMETHRLASQLMSTQDAARKAELRAELRDNLDEIFELKQTNRRAEVDQLDDRLRELRAQMDSRERNRDEIILKRIRQLLNEIE